MKLLIASDIHGSAEYCRSLIEAIKREDQLGTYIFWYDLNRKETVFSVSFAC